MTAHKITSFDSIFKTDDSAFAGSPAGANSLTVDESAYLVSTDGGSAAVYLSGSGSWNVTANGAIYSQNSVGLFVQTIALANITVGATGEIGSGSGTAIVVNQGPANIKNAGLISGGFGTDIILLTGPGNSSITNSGTIAGNISSTGGALTVTNSSKIDGGITFNAGNDKVTSSGFIDGDLSFGEGNNTYSATADSTVRNIFAGSGNDTVNVVGQIFYAVQLGHGNNKFTLGKESYFYNFDDAVNAFASGVGDDVFSNAGTIFDGNVNLGDGNNSFTNSGLIEGDVISLNGSAKFTNSGTIDGGVGFSFTTVTFKNSGTITGSVTGGAFVDTFSNTKTIGGDVLLVGGNDIVTNSGRIEGQLSLGTGDDKLTNSGYLGGLDLGDGNDTYIGGSLADYVEDSNDSDNIKLGAGDDTYGAWTATLDGADTIDGGAGIDEYFAPGPAGVSASMFVNLDTVNHDTGVLGGVATFVAAKSATGTDVGTDTITGFEDAETGDGDDVIFGTSGANNLGSHSGHDVVFGLGGNDRIFTGNGNDKIVGGAGADVMAGGNEVDYYIYLSVADSGPTKATRDTLGNFIDNSDLIDLSRIDANTKNGAAVNDPFVYINAMGEESAVFTKAAGQLRSYWTVAGQMIEGDVNGDGKADFSIFVDDIDHSITFTKDDFIL